MVQSWHWTGACELTDRDLVAVTGASGFIGRAVLRALRSAGRRVIALGTRPEDETGDDVHWERVDLCDRRSIHGVLAAHRPNVLIHAAWARSRPGGLWNLEENWAWRDASLALFEAFWQETGGHVVACGTCAEYAPVSGDCVEDLTPVAPESVYGAAKADLFERAARRALEMGGSMSWARLFYLFGPHENGARLVPSVVDKLLAGMPAETGRGLTIRDFAFVDDIGAGLLALADTQAQGAFNVATGSGTRLSDMVESIARIMNARDLLRIGALPDRPGEPGRIVADVSKMKQATGWSAPTPLEHGLRQTIDWRRHHFEKPGLEA